MATIVGAFGFSANPPHIGHQAIIQAIVSGRLVDVLHVIPCGGRADKPQLASAEARIAMTRALCASIVGNPHVQLVIDEQDAHKPDFTKTIDLLGRLGEQYPGSTIEPIIGLDLLQVRAPFEGKCEISATWRLGRTLLDVWPFLVFRRGGVEGPIESPRHWRMIDGHIPQVSSSDIRRLVRDGEPYEHLTGPAVAAIIKERGLFLETSP